MGEIMKHFLLLLSFLMVLFFGVRTLCSNVIGIHNCIPVNARDIEEINANAAAIKLLRSSLDKKIEKFGKRSTDAEFCLKHILTLLDFELEIIDNLIDKKLGLPIYQLQNRRNELIVQTVPSVVRTYDSIINCAAADASLLCKLREIIQDQQRSCTFLFYNKKEHFLQHMIAILESYYRCLREKLNR